jgi:hypothetical protein
MLRRPQREGSITSDALQAGVSRRPAIDPSACNHLRMPRWWRGRPQDDGAGLGAECTVNFRTWYHCCTKAPGGHTEGRSATEETENFIAFPPFPPLPGVTLPRCRSNDWATVKPRFGADAPTPAPCKRDAPRGSTVCGCRWRKREVIIGICSCEYRHADETRTTVADVTWSASLEAMRSAVRGKGETMPAGVPKNGRSE